MKNSAKYILAISIAASLTACGGSGGGSDMTNNKPEKIITYDEKINNDELPFNMRLKKLEWQIGDYHFMINPDKKPRINFAGLPDGLNRLILKITAETNGGDKFLNEGYAKSYQQFYTASIGMHILHSYKNGVKTGESDGFRIGAIAGTPTNAADIPNQGSVDYVGKAYNAGSEGDFTYQINFADKSGNGRVTGLNTDTITLEAGKLASLNAVDKIFKESIDWSDNKAQMLLTGQARYKDGKTGIYGIGVFGPHAKEIAGVVSDTDLEFTVGVGGSAVK